MSQTRPQLSVVVPVFNEAGNAAALGREIRDVLHDSGRSFEMIFVNDGSTDATLVELQQLGSEEARLRILDLDGNFGEAAALCAGFHAARGDLVVTLDGDGQNDPHDIPKLLDAMQPQTLVATGWRRQRQEGYWLRVLPSRIANRLIALCTRLPVHDNGCGLKVYRREVVARAQLPRGFNRFMPAIFGVNAAQVVEVPVADRRRQHGESHYGLGRVLIVMRDVLALRFILWNPRAAFGLWTVAGLLASCGAALSLLAGSYARAGWRLLIVVLAALIVWNLRRWMRAQENGVFRIRRELP